MKRTAVLAALAVAVVVPLPVATAPAALAACVPAAAPINTLEQMASGTAVRGKTVGKGWEVVVLGTVTEVRHKSPKFRYRITMRVDSVLGVELPVLYTFFGSSRGTFPFETGKSYAVPLARRTAAGPLLPTTELWVDACDPVIPVADLPAAHEVIAKTKPGYTPSPTATPSPSPSPPEQALAAPASPAAPPPRPAAARARASRVAFPDREALDRGARVVIAALGGLALLVAIAAAAESWWSRRHFA